MADLIIVVDPGRSLSKIFYSYRGQKPKLLLMEPEVIEMDVNILSEEYENKVAGAHPEECAWVQAENNAWAVGSFAKDSFRACKNLKERKSVDSLPKVLAALGIIMEREEIPASNLSICLGLLLPKEEWEARKGFEVRVREAIAHFRFRHQSLSLRLEEFNCSPEGAGLIYERRRQLGQEFKSLNIGVVIAGYQHCSYLTMKHGVFGPCDTIDLGFARLVELVRDSTSGLAIESLTPAICQAGLKVDCEKLAYLFDEDDPKRIHELPLLVKAIENAQKRYWAGLRSWLKNSFPHRMMDEIVLSGGTVGYFKPWFKQLYPSASYLEQLEKTIKLTFTRSYPFRLSDGNSFFNYLNDQNNKRAKKLVSLGVSARGPNSTVVLESR
ncbi:MAG: ParM/StbA family protein [Chroococcidiopsidaceae cyanobacterium CP_BM_RX_35]|nr:ParM/StbA family protein [Chroococcidiopsidaceae cyanobacterium CP_BM_RX_35]